MRASSRRRLQQSELLDYLEIWGTKRVVSVAVVYSIIALERCRVPWVCIWGGDVAGAAVLFNDGDSTGCVRAGPRAAGRRSVGRSVIIWRSATPSSTNGVGLRGVWIWRMGRSRRRRRFQRRRLPRRRWGGRARETVDLNFCIVYRMVNHIFARVYR